MPEITNDAAAKLLQEIVPSLINWLAQYPCSCTGCEKLREAVRKSWPKPTPAEMEEQRRSFAYGNVALHNPNVTRELVDQVADQMAREKR